MASHQPYKFAGMRDGDRVVFERFLYRYEQAFANLYLYNVRTSTNNRDIPGLPPALQPLHRTLRRKRVDVLTFGTDDPLDWPVPDCPLLTPLNAAADPTKPYLTVIEVKEVATTSVFGQVFSYPAMIRQTFLAAASYPIRVLIVAYALGQDVEWLCKFYGVPYVLV
ncbi:MAG: hypothetical protein A2Y63_00280 [Candidatus Riflebacteria bacterium RBG_13_59_9]|nr:MAG: hypothetical protein A2Y63_00280 [Candidatus Riflebacteria bacterium RBG_13_59_9]